MTKISTLKAKFEIFYKSIKEIYCPIIDDKITFGNPGWIHIRFDSRGHRRNPADIIMRFNLLPYVPEVIKNATYYVKEEAALKNGGKITYHEIAHEVSLNGKMKHVTVIMSQKPGGKLHYLSLRYTSSKTKKALRNNP